MWGEFVSEKMSIFVQGIISLILPLGLKSDPGSCSFYCLCIYLVTDNNQFVAISSKKVGEIISHNCISFHI